MNMKRKMIMAVAGGCVMVAMAAGQVFAAAPVAGQAGDGNDGVRVEWSRLAIDGSRTGCVSPSAEDIDESVGKVKGRTYYAPNGRVYKGGSIAGVASVVLAAQPVMAPVKKVIGYSPEAMVRAYPECALSDMFIDVLMAAVEREAGRKVDVGIGNFGGIRVDMPQGDILLDDLVSMFPFRNSIVYVSLKGDDLRKILEHMAATRIQVLGGVRIEVSDGKLLSAVIDGEPLDDGKVYGVATISFLLDGGDNLHIGRNALEIRNFDDIDIIDVMLDYVDGETAAGRPVTYRTDGRVRIIPSAAED